MRSDVLSEIFAQATDHRQTHACGGYPYMHGDVLTTLVTAQMPERVLELGTGLGYTAACLALGGSTVIIDTIDQDESHLSIARKNWERLSIEQRINTYAGKAEGVLPRISHAYDLIFFDGYAPSMKFLIHFERLLKTNGLLVTANLFVKDSSGGKYVRALKNTKKWQSGFFSDTAISVKLR